MQVASPRFCGEFCGSTNPMPRTGKEHPEGSAYLQIKPGNDVPEFRRLPQQLFLSQAQHNVTISITLCLYHPLPVFSVSFLTVLYRIVLAGGLRLPLQPKALEAVKP